MDSRLTSVLRSLAPAVALLLLSPASALAHAELVSTTPADGVVLDEPPTEVVLAFDDELDPAASGFVVTAEDGSQVGSGEVDLQVADRNELRGAVDIDTGGRYTVAWTVAGSDGHAIEGSVAFTVGADAPAGEPPAPDTAVPDDPGSWPTGGLGVLVLLAGLGLAGLALNGRRSRP